MSDKATTDRTAWVRSVLTEYEQPLIRYAVRMTGDAERARDVVQDVFVRLCDVDPGEMNGRMPAWLYTVCRNRALDVLRKDGRMTTVADERIETSDTAEHEPSFALERKETASRVGLIIDDLPANQREVLALRFENDLSYRDIAAVTNLTVSNVGYLIHTAIRTLRERLAAAGD